MEHQLLRFLSKIKIAFINNRFSSLQLKHLSVCSGIFSIASSEMVSTSARFLNQMLASFKLMQKKQTNNFAQIMLLYKLGSLLNKKALSSPF